MRPDEKSVMAYVAFFWKEFAANKRKNLAAERIGTVVAREQSFLQLQEQYTAQATELSQWLQEREAFFKKEAEGNSMGEVEKALASRALDALETSPAAAEPAMALREVLTTGPNWGWPVAGVHVTKRLLIRGAGVAVTLWTLMGGVLQGGADLG